MGFTRRKVKRCEPEPTAQFQDGSSRWQQAGPVRMLQDKCSYFAHP